MKHKILLLTLIISVFFVCKISAQKLEAEVTQELSKDARKGELVGFEYDKNAKEYWLIFKREKSSKAIYEVYQFDYDLELIKNEILEEETAKQTLKNVNIFQEPDNNEWTNPKVVRMGNNPGQITLRLGTLVRKWHCDYTTAGNYLYSTCYYKFDFDEEKTVKPKYNPNFDYPSGTPKAIKKLVTNLASKVAPLEYMTDEPTMNIITGKRSGWSKITMDFRKFDFTDASGDIVIAGLQQYPLNDEWIAKIKVLQYSAKDLSLFKEQSLDLEYGVMKAYSKKLSDGTFIVILYPNKVQKGTSDPNPQHFYYLRVSKNGEIVSNTYFETPCREWGIADVALDDNGDVFLYGLASDKKNGKFANTGGAPIKSTGLQVVKFTKEGKMIYATLATLDDMEAKLKKPGNQKKSNSFGGKAMNIEADNYIITEDGELIVSGRMWDNSAINFFHFDATGNFKAQYTVIPEQNIKEGAVDYGLFLNSDGNTATVLLAEFEFLKKGRALKYPRLSLIDLSSASIGEMKTFGYSKSGKYYLDDIYPFTVVDESRITFFSRDAKDNEIWLGRVILTK